MRGKQMRWATFAVILVLGAFFAPMALAAAENQTGEGKQSSTEVMAIVIATAFVVGTACLAAGYAVARVGAAALGAASERPELLGRSLILVGLAEGIAIYGLIIGIMMLGLMG